MFPTEGGFRPRPRGFVDLPMPGGPVDEGIWEQSQGLTPLPSPGGSVDQNIAALVQAMQQGTFQPPVAGGYQPRPAYQYDPVEQELGNISPTLPPPLRAAKLLGTPRGPAAPKPPRFDMNTAQHITKLLGQKRYHRRGRR